MSISTGFTKGFWWFLILPIMVSGVLAQAQEQEDCEVECTNREKAILICDDINTKAQDLYADLGDRYRKFVQKYNKNINLVKFSVGRFDELRVETELMEDVIQNIEQNNQNLQQTFDTITRDTLYVDQHCGEQKIDLKILKIQSDKQSFERILTQINADLKALKTLIENI